MRLSFAKSIVAVLAAAALCVAPATAQSATRYYGGLAGTATVSAAGNAAYSLPIQMPAKLSSATPDVRLVYNSNIENGLFGAGWFLQGLDSVITRCERTKAQDGYSKAITNTNSDAFCLDGNRLMLTSGTYGADGATYRTENDQFVRVESVGTSGDGPLWFRAWYKDGSTASFGQNPPSALKLPGTNTIRSWAINVRVDRNSNYYDVLHVSDDAKGERYPVHFVYGQNPLASVGGWGTPEHRRLTVEYEARSDIDLSYQAGAPISRHPKRVSAIIAFVGAAEQYRYSFNYEEVGPANLSRLTSIERCTPSAVCQEPLTIEWESDGSTGFTSTTQPTPGYRGIADYYFHLRNPYGGIMTSARGTEDTPPDTNYPRWHDLNGDGQDDYILANPTRDDATEFDVLLSGPAGYTMATWTTADDFDEDNAHWADINGDGRTDLMVISRKPGNAVEYHVSFSTDTGFSNVLFGSGGWESNRRSQLADMDGDHLPDLMIFVPNDSQSYSLHFRKNMGTYFAAGVLIDSHVWRHGELADFDGDGLADLMQSTFMLRRNLRNGPHKLDSSISAFLGYAANLTADS